MAISIKHSQKQKPDQLGNGQTQDGNGMDTYTAQPSAQSVMASHTARFRAALCCDAGKPNKPYCPEKSMASTGVRAGRTIPHIHLETLNLALFSTKDHTGSAQPFPHFIRKTTRKPILSSAAGTFPASSLMLAMFQKTNIGRFWPVTALTITSTMFSEKLTNSPAEEALFIHLDLSTFKPQILSAVPLTTLSARVKIGRQCRMPFACRRTLHPLSFQRKDRFHDQ